MNLSTNLFVLHTHTNMQISANTEHRVCKNASLLDAPNMPMCKCMFFLRAHYLPIEIDSNIILI